MSRRGRCASSTPFREAAGFLSGPARRSRTSSYICCPSWRSTASIADVGNHRLHEVGLDLLILAGLATFYGLEKLAGRDGEKGESEGTANAVFWIHIGSFAAYAALIGYTLAEEVGREARASGSVPERASGRPVAGEPEGRLVNWRAREASLSWSLALPGTPMTDPTVTSPPLSTRDAVDADLPRIVEIYNESVPGGWSTADTRPVTVDSRREWFAQRDPARRPIWVAEIETAPGAAEIVGWVSLTSFYRGRPAYDATAEISVYVASGWQRRGIGRALKQAMIARCPALGVTTLVSMHFDHNEATQRLNDELGFERAGWLPEIAVVQGQKRGLVLSLLRVAPDGGRSGEPSSGESGSGAG